VGGGGGVITLLLVILRSSGALQPKVAALRPIVALLVLVILRSNWALEHKVAALRSIVALLLLAAFNYVANSGSLAIGGSQVTGDSKAKDPFDNSNMESKKAHVSGNLQ